jgi:hypothetical protein
MLPLSFQAAVHLFPVLATQQTRPFIWFSSRDDVNVCITEVTSLSQLQLADWQESPFHFIALSANDSAYEMAPLDDASCGGSAIRNPLTTLRKQDNVDRSLRQDRLRPNSNNCLGQTMRSGLQEPTLDFQKVCISLSVFISSPSRLHLVSSKTQLTETGI